MPAIPKSARCPCTSGKPYGECCAPFHTGGREPQTPEELVRARYSAFALGEVEFLWRTLHEDHPDRTHGRDKTLIALKIASNAYKYMGLVMLEVDPNRALYLAKIFQKGREVSFVELAEFEPDAKTGGMRYLRGKAVDRDKLGVDPTRLSMATFPA